LKCILGSDLHRSGMLLISMFEVSAPVVHHFNL
jgi:hypothetical protein